MSQLDEHQKYVNDPRIPCRYGVNCYQKNKIHNEKYKHPCGRKLPEKKHIRKKLRVETKNAGPFTTKVVYSDSDDEQTGESISRDTHKVGKNIVTNDVSGSDESDSDLSDRNHTEKFTKISNNISESNDSSDAEMDSSNLTSTEKNISVKSYEQEMEDFADIFKAVDESDIDAISKYKDFIRENFLVDMPINFFNFWNFCKKLKASNPQDALKDIGLVLIGPYDVLAGKFTNANKIPSQYLIHWRYFRDPPEFQTVLKGDDKFGYHIGYFRDSPDELPIFLCSNQSKKDGVLTQMGGNIFAALNFYLEDLKKSGDPFKKMHIGRIQTALKKEVSALRMDMSKRTNDMVAREKKIVTRSFNKIGLVVPFDKKTEVGYRELALSNNDLNTLLTKLQNVKSDEEKSKYLSQLQPVFTFTNIATDECDFGTGIELGWNMIAHGIGTLNSTIKDFLVTNYRLLNKEAFAKIAEAHMENRRMGCNLSIL